MSLFVPSVFLNQKQRLQYSPCFSPNEPQVVSYTSSVTGDRCLEVLVEHYYRILFSSLTLEVGDPADAKDRFPGLPAASLERFGFEQMAINGKSNWRELVYLSQSVDDVQQVVLQAPCKGEEYRVGCGEDCSFN